MKEEKNQKKIFNNKKLNLNKITIKMNTNFKLINMSHNLYNI